MELHPYEEIIRSILISVLTPTGWIGVVYMNIESAGETTPKDIQDGINEIHRLFYEGDKVELKVQGRSVVFRNVSSNTYKIEASTHVGDSLYNIIRS